MPTSAEIVAAYEAITEACETQSGKSHAEILHGYAEVALKAAEKVRKQQQRAPYRNCGD